MKWGEMMKEYLTFSKKERIAVLVIVSLMPVIWFLPKILSRSKGFTLTIDTTLLSQVGSRTSKPTAAEDENLETSDRFIYDRTIEEKQIPELFYFDPNTISESEWKRLGIKLRTIRTIKNFLNKGGHFRTKEDLKKIYGLSTPEYERLFPFINIKNEKNKSSFEKDNYNFKIQEKTFSKPSLHPIDINTADTTALIALPGIGNKLAMRIINFREKLGGFYSIDQVSETYGIADSTFQKIRHWLRISKQEVKQLNINLATKDELKTHPYLKWTIANAIVEYRNQHGNYSSVDDLKKISLITEEVFKKIRLYLSI